MAFPGYSKNGNNKDCIEQQVVTSGCGVCVVPISASTRGTQGLAVAPKGPTNGGLSLLVGCRVRPVPDPAEKPQPFSAVGLLLTRTSQSLADMQTES